ncbi:MAG: hypothetical protein IKA23_08100, partial [Akkermansia sp.]|nr:hypothetical protein [Akkermansia sp.]
PVGGAQNSARLRLAKVQFVVESKQYSLIAGAIISGLLVLHIYVISFVASGAQHAPPQGQENKPEICPLQQIISPRSIITPVTQYRAGAD